MAQQSRHDAWQAGDAYDAYMGRWSRRIAPLFLDWLTPRAGLDWLELGCGTGALSAAIIARADPRSLLAVEPSAGFVARARAAVTDPRAGFVQGDAQALALPDASRDVIVSGLMLNFVPDRLRALHEMKRVARHGATVAFYVWDYPGGGIAFMRAFWDAAVALDPAAADLTESRRFPDCTEAGLCDLAARAGLADVSSTALETPTVFADFEDYWRPFTLGAGPAPGYCGSLSPDARARLRQKLHDDLPRDADGKIHLQARAWAVRATVG